MHMIFSATIVVTPVIPVFICCYSSLGRFDCLITIIYGDIATILNEIFRLYITSRDHIM